MGKFGRRVVQMQVQVLVDVCVHNGINVGELIGRSRKANRIPLLILKVHRTYPSVFYFLFFIFFN